MTLPGRSHVGALLLLLLLLGGCATVPFERTELVPAPQRSAAQLAAGLWSAGKERLLIRQSALFELQGMRVPIAGMMRLDLGAKQARLVGMNDMGVKLYDISVDADSSRTQFVVPELARYPGFAEAVAVSVRRIFLVPEPAPGDLLELLPKSYLLTRQAGAGAQLSFTLGGAEAQLLEKSCRGPAESWRVRYYLYQRREGLLFPGGIVLDDDQAGYRLTLWIESVEKTDE
ncbi:MAG TPA: hypothetical protein DCZ75_09555 [Geobacter sp.]|nr:hypothetical protein [Geobacter sp.]